MKKGENQKNLYLSLVVTVLISTDHDRSLNESQLLVEEFVGIFRILKLVRREINDKFSGSISAVKWRASSDSKHGRKSPVG